MCLPSVALVISLLICHHRWSLLFTCFFSLHYLSDDFTHDDIGIRQASEVMDDQWMRGMKNSSKKFHFSENICGRTVRQQSDF